MEPVIGELYDGTACIDGTGRIGEVSKLIGRHGTRHGDLGVEPFQTRLAHGLGELALPDDDDMPSGGFERGVLRDVAVMVAGQFRGPEFDVRFGHACGLRTAFVHVPEAAVDEYDRTVFR